MDMAATLKLAAFAVAIEACLGYPQGLFRAIGHPVTWTGHLIAIADGRLNHDDRSFATRRALGFAALFLLLLIAGGGAYLFSLGLAGLELPQPASLALTALIASESHRATQPRCPRPCRCRSPSRRTGGGPGRGGKNRRP